MPNFDIDPKFVTKSKDLDIVTKVDGSLRVFAKGRDEPTDSFRVVELSNASGSWTYVDLSDKLGVEVAQNSPITARMVGDDPRVYFGRSPDAHIVEFEFNGTDWSVGQFPTGSAPPVNKALSMPGNVMLYVDQHRQAVEYAWISSGEQWIRQTLVGEPWDQMGEQLTAAPPGHALTNMHHRLFVNNVAVHHGGSQVTLTNTTTLAGFASEDMPLFQPNQTDIATIEVQDPSRGQRFVQRTFAGGAGADPSKSSLAALRVGDTRYAYLRVDATKLREVAVSARGGFSSTDIMLGQAMAMGTVLATATDPSQNRHVLHISDNGSLLHTWHESATGVWRDEVAVAAEGGQTIV